jgi:hypothetical protein
VLENWAQVAPRNSDQGFSLVTERAPASRLSPMTHDEASEVAVGVERALRRVAEVQRAHRRRGAQGEVRSGRNGTRKKVKIIIAS